MGEREKILASGFTASHWDIVSINYNVRSGTIEVSYAWFKSKLAKEAGRSAIHVDTIEFPISDTVKDKLIEFVTAKIEATIL